MRDKEVKQTRKAWTDKTQKTKLKITLNSQELPRESSQPQKKQKLEEKDKTRDQKEESNETNKENHK